MSALKRIPGDPDYVEAKAQRYAAIAQSIQESARRLREIARMDGIRSDAIEAMRERAATTADSISRAGGRYGGTAQALAEYAPVHRDCQALAEAAAAEYEQAQEGAARAAHTSEQHTTNAAQGGASQKADEKQAAYFEGLAAERQGTANAAYARYTDAWERWRAAAASAAAKIDTAVDESGLNNTLWDTIVNVVKAIGEVAAVAAIFFSWVPILGQILTVIAIVGAIVSLIDGIAALMRTGDWAAFAGTALSSLLGLFGGGIIKFLSKGITMAAHSGKLVQAGTFVSRRDARKLGMITGKKRAQLFAANQRGAKDFFKDSFAFKKSDFGFLPRTQGSTDAVFAWKNLVIEGKARFWEMSPNPLGLKSLDMMDTVAAGGSAVPKHLTVSLAAMDVRSVLGKAEALTNNPFDIHDERLTLRPDAILSKVLHGESPTFIPSR